MKPAMVLSILCLGPAFAFANPFDNRWVIGAGGGLAFPQRPESFQDGYDQGVVMGGSVGYGIANDLSIVGSYAHILIKEDQEDPSVERADVELQPIILSLKYHPFARAPVVPYLKVGAGVSVSRQEILGAPDEHWNKFAAQAGVGLEFFFCPWISLSTEGLYHHIVGLPAESPYRLVTATGFLNAYFGLNKELKNQRAKKHREEMTPDYVISEQERITKEVLETPSDIPPPDPEPLR